MSECLVRLEPNASLDLRLSFLQLLPQAATETNITDPSLGWNEAVERNYDCRGITLGTLLAAPLSLSIQPADDVTASLSISARRLPSGAAKLHLEVENVSQLAEGIYARRDEALPHSLVSAHVLLGVTGGEFVSLLDPQEPYSEETKGCINSGVFPVLAGQESDRSIMFLSPIILYDYPKIAPESAGDFFDGTEMDEMLTLRVLTLTDEEKQEMRNGDARARRIIERTEALTGDEMLKAHGIVRSMREIRGDA